MWKVKESRLREWLSPQIGNRFLGLQDSIKCIMYGLLLHAIWSVFIAVSLIKSKENGKKPRIVSDACCAFFVLSVVSGIVHGAYVFIPVRMLVIIEKRAYMG